jgi:16S rRNA (guanine(966)-N(2))-methyltransferase RsmD
MLRVIAGELGGRRLRVPGGQKTRPTADRVRESLFSILGPLTDGAKVLDLYAGSGALGIEALSRGARSALFVEQDAQVSRILSGNLRDLGLAGRAAVLTRSVRAALGQAELGGPFELVFADPPYASEESAWLLSQLAQAPLLAAGGTVILERASRDAEATLAATAPSGLVPTDRRRYGDTTLLFFGRLAATSER